MNVLSLFDGISCGQLALNRAGIKYDNYYASEIEKYSIQVTQEHYPETVQLGDVTALDFSSLPSIDLLIGGSPCVGFSSAGKKLRFEDTRSGLIKYFFEAKEYLNPKYFLLENVVMPKNCLDLISERIGVQPVLINSNLFSGQNRKRYYWTNIPIMPIKDRNINFNCSLYHIPHGNARARITTGNKYPTLVKNPGGTHKIIEVVGNDICKRTVYANECESLQTLPIGYTVSIPKTHRYRCIGDAWTVDVIAHIFKGMIND